MSSFTAPLILEALPTVRGGRGEFRVHVAFTYEIGHKGSGDRVTGPQGYNTDLASIPWFARAFVPLAGPCAKPALIHDWMLDQGDPRAHDVFDEALNVAGVRPLTRRIMVASVRLNGRFKQFLRLFKPMQKAPNPA